eukprot:15430443-Alexandrium_andersonii.AAC.1
MCIRDRADLWYFLWLALAQHPGSFELRWVPAHLPESAVAQGLLEREAWLCNSAADAFAEHAAGECQLEESVHKRVREK